MTQTNTVAGKMSSTTRWRDITRGDATPTDAGERMMKIGTVAIIDHDEAQSTYAFNAELTFRVDGDSGQVTVSACSGRAPCLDGMDRGSVRYASRAPWRAAIAGDQFELGGVLSWTDRFNEDIDVGLQLSGLVREDGSIDRLKTTLEGEAVYDPDATQELLMEVPAVW